MRPAARSAPPASVSPGSIEPIVLAAIRTTSSLAALSATTAASATFPGRNLANPARIPSTRTSTAESSEDLFGAPSLLDTAATADGLTPPAATSPPDDHPAQNQHPRDLPRVALAIE